MKTRITTIIFALAIACASMFTTSCNNIDKPVVTDVLTPSLSITDCTESQRAMARFTLLPEESPYNLLRPITVEYTIDGKEAFIQRVMGGEDFPVDQKNWDPAYDMNFVSGSQMIISLWENHVPTMRFMMPQMPAGTHTITMNLEDEHGVTATVTGSWNVVSE